MVTNLRKLTLAAALAVALPLVLSDAASAQTREFSGKIDKIQANKVIIDNRMGDKVAFNRVDETVVEGEKTKWDDLKKDDWVIVHWKFIDKPRKAYKVVVTPPKEEAGEEVE
jgi:hypothetical protein